MWGAVALPDTYLNKNAARLFPGPPLSPFGLFDDCITGIGERRDADQCVTSIGRMYQPGRCSRLIVRFGSFATGSS